MQAPGYQLPGDIKLSGCNTGRGVLQLFLIFHCKNMCRQTYKSAQYKQEEFP